MSTHNIGFYEDLTKIIFELSSNTHLISSADYMRWIMRKPAFCIYAKTKVHISCAVTMQPRLCFNWIDKENPSLVFSGDKEIPTRGSTVPVGNEALPSFPLERWTRGL